MMNHERFSLDGLPPEESLMEVDGEPTMVQHDTTRRINDYEQIFHLTPEDVAGKVVVDLGASKHQDFAEEVDRSTRYEPKMMISVDPLAEFKERDKLNVVAAKAEAMPFHENVDLILACNSVPLYLRTPESILQAFEEIINSLKVGGEARIFPLAYSPLGHGYDAETNTIETSRIVYPPNDNGMFKEILQTLEQKYQIQITQEPKWNTDPEDPEEKIMLITLKIRKIDGKNATLPVE